MIRRRPFLPAGLGATAAIAGIGAIAALATTGGDVQTGGAIAAAGLALASAGAVITTRRLAHDPSEEERAPGGHHGLPCACGDPGRRRVIGGVITVTAAVMASGLFTWLWSSAPAVERRLRRTAWAPGRRLVDERGRPMRADDLEEGAFVTVFPEGNTDAADAQAVLIRLRPGRTLTDAGRADWTVSGCVAYSKLCTHMGCPVGLYQTQAEVLVCPCHQATFDVLRGAVPIFGPASRPLPQLPLTADGTGYLVAAGDFPDAVGPNFWGRRVR